MSTIVGGGLTARVDASRGAKITSLVDDRGVEWLAQADPTRDVTSGLAFTDAEMAGWDECAPSIVACVIDGVEIPDHGDLWDAPFTAVGEGLVAVGASLGYRFERRILPHVRGLMLEYRAEALREPMPFLWAAHPQFLAPPGTSVSIGPALPTVVDVLDPNLPEVPLTASLATIDSVPRGGTRKWYARPSVAVRSATLHRADGSRLEVAWDASCPYVGIWFDNGAYSREPVIAIEPTTGYFDAVDRARASGLVATLHPGEPLTWSISLSVVVEGSNAISSRAPR